MDDSRVWWEVEQHVLEASRVCQVSRCHCRMPSSNEFRISSSDPEVQVVGFKGIVTCITQFPSMRSIYRDCCEQQGYSVGNVVAAWTLTSDRAVKGSIWNHFYMLAVYCLVENEVTNVVDRIASFSEGPLDVRSQKLKILFKDLWSLCLGYER